GDHPALTLPCRAAPAALGFRLHTGWAALVAIAGVPGKFQVLLRRRIELLPRGDSVPRFVYHKAAELPPSEAVELVSRAEVASEESARTAVKEVLEHLGSLAVTVKAVGIPCSSRPVPTDVSAVLRPHPMILTEEGFVFQRPAKCDNRSSSMPTSLTSALSPETIRQHGLTPDEYEKIRQLLGGREPTITELGIFSVMWSEHCSYKSSRVHLKRLPTRSKRVLQ